MDRLLYSFQITYFDEIDHIEKTKSGFIFGDTLMTIIKDFDDYWGEDNIKDLRLTYIGANSCDMIIMPDNVLHSSFLNDLKKENFW